MTGETDVDLMLASISVTRRPGVWVMVCTEAFDSLGAGVDALIREAEGTTAVVERETAKQHGLTWTFEAAWLTLDVHSALEAVGLTAAFSRCLTDANISCNVIAGAFHDHLLVPVDRVDDAVAAIEQLRASHSSEHDPVT